MSCLCTRWACDLTNWRPTLKQLCQAIVTVQVEERERIMRFHFFEDFLSSLVGRLLMRKFVSDVSGLTPNQVHFERDERGKPYWDLVEVTQPQSKRLLKTPSEICFNVSHQGGLVILAGITTADDETTAIKPSFGVGADVMKIEYTGGKSLNEFFRIMHRKFSTSEWEYIMKGCEAQQLKAFMRHWCLKEAYVKELGVGITIDLQKISFTVDNKQELSAKPLSNAALSLNGKSMTNWHFEEHLLRPDYCAAIAFKNCRPSQIDNFTFLSFDDLILSTSDTSENCLVDYCNKALNKPSKSVL